MYTPSRRSEGTRAGWALACCVGAVVPVLMLGTVSWAGRRGPRPPGAGVPAHTADAQGGCNCPAPAEASFNITLVRNRADVSPIPEFSEASTSVLPVRTSTDPQYQITSIATFWLSDETRAIFSCSLRVNSDRQHLVDRGTCTLSLFKDGQPDAIGQASVASIEVPTLDDTHVQITLPILSFTLTGGEIVNVKNIAFRAADPSAHYITVPRGYHP